MRHGEVHTFWSQHACFGSCEQSSAALVFHCMPHRNVRVRCCRDLNVSGIIQLLCFGWQSTHKQKLKCTPKISWVLWWQHNTINKTGTAGQVHVHQKARADSRYVLHLENAGGGGLGQVSVLFAFFGMVEWSKAKRRGAPPLRQHPALRLPAGASLPAAAEIALSWMRCVGRGGAGGSDQKKSRL